MAPRLRHLHPVWYPTDFCVYFAASRLVAQGHSAQLYTGIDDGRNAPKLIAGPSTPIYQAIREYHFHSLGFYIYPPLLADLLLPLAHLELFQAWKVWLVFNGLLLLATGSLLARLVDLPFRSSGFAVLLLALFSFAPVVHCLVVGQVTILLLFLFTWGILLDKQNHEFGSAAVFALAAVIKLTPALVLVPFLFWRRWRWAAGFLIGCSSLLLFCALVNTPHSLAVFFTRVTPGMANAVPDTLNFSIASMVERLIMALQGDTYRRLLNTPTAFDRPFFDSVPRAIFLIGKAVSTLFLLSFLALIARRTQNPTPQERVLVLALLAFLSAIVSPVSWLNAYAAAFIAFVVLWYEVLTVPTSWRYLLGLTCVSILLGSPVLTRATIDLVNKGHFIPSAVFGTFTITAAGCLLLCRLYRQGDLSRKGPDAGTIQASLIRQSPSSAHRDMTHSLSPYQHESCSRPRHRPSSPTHTPAQPATGVS